MTTTMAAFEIRLPGRTVFGRGTAPKAVAQSIAGFSRPFVVHGRSQARAQWLIDLLAEGGGTVTPFICDGEPDVATLERALAAARSVEADCIIGLGGGAALDLAKAVAGLATAGGALFDYLEVVGAGKPIDNEPLFFIAIPTTSGTGAEATRNAVIGVPSHKRKVSIRDPRMIADVAIVDAALTDGCPRSVTMASGLDAITQLIEPYISIRANAFTDALVMAALEPALVSIRTLSAGDDPAARDTMAFASHASGICLSHAGLGVVHGLAGVIGGMSGLPHGQICAGLLAPSLMVNRAAIVRRGADTTRIDEMDRLLGRVFGDLEGDDGFARLAGFVADLGIIGPVEPETDLENIAKLASDSSSFKANPVALDSAEIVEILELSMN